MKPMPQMRNRRGGRAAEKPVAVELSEHELVLLMNAINEALNAVDEWEFETRLGARPAEAKELHRKLRSLLAPHAGSE